MQSIGTSVLNVALEMRSAFLVGLGCLGLVETSTNLASVTLLAGGQGEKGAAVQVACLTRSSLTSALENTRDRIRRIAGLVGASACIEPAYPG